MTFYIFSYVITISMITGNAHKTKALTCLKAVEKCIWRLVMVCPEALEIS